MCLPVPWFHFRLGSDSEMRLPCLGLLANLCRNNISMQAHIKALVSKTPFFPPLKKKEVRNVFMPLLNGMNIFLVLYYLLLCGCVLSEGCKV